MNLLDTIFLSISTWAPYDLCHLQKYTATAQEQKHFHQE